MKLNKRKFKQLVRESIFNLLEGDITREKRYQWDEEEPESADEPEPPPEPDAPPVDLISKAKELHTSLTHYASAAETQPGRADASQRVVVRTYLRELGEILDELAEHIGPGTGDTEVEARGHDEDESAWELPAYERRHHPGGQPGWELPKAPSTRSLAHQRRRTFKNR